MNNQRVILTGFMATGKTTVGKRLVELLRFPFFDTDEMIAAGTGEPIARIFEKMGEAFFRARETEALREALAQDRVVVATGGGAALDPSNRNLLRRSGLWISLNATPEVIEARIGASELRPLLGNGNRLATIRRLLKERAPLYREAGHWIETTDRNLEETVEEILRLIPWKPSGSS